MITGSSKDLDFTPAIVSKYMNVGDDALSTSMKSIGSAITGMTRLQSMIQSVMGMTSDDLVVKNETYQKPDGTVLHSLNINGLLRAVNNNLRVINKIITITSNELVMFANKAKLDNGSTVDADVKDSQTVQKVNPNQKRIG